MPTSNEVHLESRLPTCYSAFMDESKNKRDWLTLALIPGIGTTQFIRLLARFRTPTDILNASVPALNEVVGGKLAQHITQYAEVVDLGRQLELMKDYQVNLVTLDDPHPKRHPLHTRTRIHTIGRTSVLQHTAP